LSEVEPKRRRLWLRKATLAAIELANLMVEGTPIRPRKAGVSSGRSASATVSKLLEMAAYFRSFRDLREQQVAYQLQACAIVADMLLHDYNGWPWEAATTDDIADYLAEAADPTDYRHRDVIQRLYGDLEREEDERRER
jgi:hypothetical protein